MLPDGTVSIGEGAFRDCNNLVGVTMPGTVNFIGDQAFFGCPDMNLTVMGNGEYYTYIDGVLYNKDVTKVVFVSSFVEKVCIPNTVTDIHSVFGGHANIQSVTFESDSQVTNIAEKAFYQCNNLTSIVLPGSVTSIGAHAFDGCGNLTSISIPGSVTRIGGYAFTDCVRLKNVTIPNGVTCIEEGLFRFCSNLTSIVLPDGLTKINAWAFERCSCLMSITIPSSVISIGSEAFAQCDNLYIVHNNSDLMPGIGSEDHGKIARNAKMVIDKNGNK